MATEELKCSSFTENPQKNKSIPEHASPSIWSCITSVTKWTDIIKQAGKVNKSDSAKGNHKFTTLKEKKKTTTSSVKVTQTQLPKSCSNENGNPTDLKKGYASSKKFDQNVESDEKNKIQKAPKKIIQFNKPMLHRTIKRQLYKSSSQEVNVKLNKEKHNIHWIENVSVHEFYKVEENLIDDKKKKCEHQRTTRNTPTATKCIRDEKKRILVLLLQKMKKLEIQMRDLQFLNLKKKIPQVPNKQVIKQVPVIQLKVNENIKMQDRKLKQLNLLKFKENIDVPMNGKVPVLTFERRKSIRPEKLNKTLENIRAKRKRRSLKSNEKSKYRNQIKESLPPTKDTARDVLPSVKTVNYGLQIQDKATDTKDQATLWLLFNRIRCLENQIKLLAESVNDKPKIKNILNVNQSSFLSKEMNHDIKKSKCNKLGMNIIQEKSENTKNNDLYELYFSSKKKGNTKLNDNSSRQGRRLSTVNSLNKKNNHLRGKKNNIFNIVKEITSEKITQTSKQYFTSLSKTEITGDNNHRMSSTTEIDTDLEMPTKDYDYKNSSGLIKAACKSEIEPQTNSVQDETFINVRKARYSYTTMSTQKSNNYYTNEETTSRYEDEGETTGDIYDSEITEHAACKTTTEDEDYESENLSNGRKFKTKNDENQVKTELTGDNELFNGLNINHQKNGITKSNTLIGYDLFPQKSYISAKERQKIDEELRKQQREIYAKLLQRNNIYNSSFGIIKNNSYLNVKLTSAMQKTIRSTTSSAESGDGIMSTSPNFSVITTLSQASKSPLPVYYNINNPDSKIFSPEFLTPQHQPNNNKNGYTNSLSNNFNTTAKSEIVCPVLRDFPVRDWYKEHLIRQNVRWKSLTSIPAVRNDFIKELREIKNNYAYDNNYKAIKRKIGDIIIKDVSCKKNNSDILMNVIQLSQSNKQIVNKSAAYLVLVSDETSNIQKIVDEDKIKEVTISLKNSFDDSKENGSGNSLTEKYSNESAIIKFKVIKSKEITEEKKDKENMSSVVSTSTSKNNKSDSHVVIKSNADKKGNKSDSHVLLKRSNNPKMNDAEKEEKSKELMLTKRVITTRSTAIVKTRSKAIAKTNSDSKKKCNPDINKCQCVITGTNVCFPPLNYIDYNLSTTHISKTETCLPDVNTQQSKKRRCRNIIQRLQKEIELQRKEVHELKKIWSKCSSRLEDIWRTSKQQTFDLDTPSYCNQNNLNQQCNFVNVDTCLTDKSMEDIVANKDIHKNSSDGRTNDSNRSDENMLMKNDIMNAFECLAETSLLLSGIVAEAKQSQNRISATQLSQSSLSYKQPNEIDGCDYNRGDKIEYLKNQLKLELFQNDQSRKRKSRSKKRRSLRLVVESDLNSSSNDSLNVSGSVKVRLNTSDKSIQTSSSKSGFEHEINGTHALIRVQMQDNKNKSKYDNYNSSSSTQIDADDENIPSEIINKNK